MSTPVFGPGIEVSARITPEFAQILTPEAMAFVAKLQRAFGGRRDELLARRAHRQAEFDAGKLPDFLPGTRAVREGDWTCAPYGADIADRRVEITGPVDRKMIVNALNSGAQVFMADFEDANTPRWDNNLQGHINLRDAIRRRIDFVSPEGKSYALKEKLATLFVRPRGWHLPEKHVKIDGKPCPAASSTSGCTSSTTRRNWSRGAAVRTSTCRSSKATSRRGCGTTSSSWRRTSSAFPPGPSRPPC
jgi:malate synthase